MKGCKIWNPETKNFMYIQDVVFREIKDVVKRKSYQGSKNQIK
jgi:hypothetical protein